MSGKVMSFKRSPYGLKHNARGTVIYSSACKLLGLSDALPMHVFCDWLKTVLFLLLLQYM